MISDPAFYAVAVPAVLLIGLAKSGFLGGFGALATPLMALAMPVPQAAAILLPLLLLSDALGLQRLWRESRPELLRTLLPASVVGIGLGALLLGSLSPKVMAAVIGALTLAFVVQRVLWPPKADRPAPPRWVGRLCGLMSGFTSFLAHAGSPPIAAYLLPMRLSPLAYSGTVSVFFAVTNLVKCVPYAALGLLDVANLTTSLVLTPLAPAGVWLGVWLLKRVDPRVFYKLAYLGMTATGLKLLWDGLS